MKSVTISPGKKKKKKEKKEKKNIVRRKTKCTQVPQSSSVNLQRSYSKISCVMGLYDCARALVRASPHHENMLV